MPVPDLSAPLSAFPGDTPCERLSAWAAAKLAATSTPAEMAALHREARETAHARMEMREL